MDINYYEKKLFCSTQKKKISLITNADQTTGPQVNMKDRAGQKNEFEIKLCRPALYGQNTGRAKTDQAGPLCQPFMYFDKTKIFSQMINSNVFIILQNIIKRLFSNFNRFINYNQTNKLFENIKSDYQFVDAKVLGKD